MSIYEPREDSFLLIKVLNKIFSQRQLLKKTNRLKICDMGSGSGIQAATIKKLGYKNILAVDINHEAITHLKKNKISALQSNLFSHKQLHNKKFDFIIFNPPYLPEDKREPEESKLQTTAGKKGYELILRFLDEAKHHLTKNGKIIILFSSLSKPLVIKKHAEKLGYNLKLLDKQKLFFEELFVYEITLENK